MVEAASFSVVVPTWNRVSTLPRALASILAQTAPPLEVIVVDDGSSDGSAAMLAKRFPSVRVVGQSRNQGSAAARNIGIRAAKGTHVAWLDSDDAWLPDYLAEVAAAWAQSPDAVFVHTDYVKVAERDPTDRRTVTVTVPQDQVGAMLHNNFVHTCSIFSAPTELMRSVGGFDPAFKVSHDRALFLRLLLHGKAAHWAKPLALRHVGEDNLINDMASWWTGCLELMADSLAHPELKRYGEAESAMRLELWNAIQWHHRDLERRLTQRKVSEAPPDGAGSEAGTIEATKPCSKAAHLPLSLGARRRPAIVWPPALSGVVLFLHSAGVPAMALGMRSAEITGLAVPEAHFALDGPILEAMRQEGSGDFAHHLRILTERAVATGQAVLTARLAAEDLARIDGEAAFERLFDLPVRAVRWRWQDRALQAVLASGIVGESGRPSFRLLARSLVEIEESEAFIEGWCRSRSIEAPVLTVEDLSTGVARVLTEQLRFLVRQPLPSIAGGILRAHPRACAAARWFRAEAARRHWSHALD